MSALGCAGSGPALCLACCPQFQPTPSPFLCLSTSKSQRPSSPLELFRHADAHAPVFHMTMRESAGFQFQKNKICSFYRAATWARVAAVTAKMMTARSMCDSSSAGCCVALHCTASLTSLSYPSHCVVLRVFRTMKIDARLLSRRRCRHSCLSKSRRSTCEKQHENPGA